MRFFKYIFTFACLAAVALATAQGARLKDLARVQGVRSNQLVGYGLVAGLAGTGESNSKFTEQSFRSMLNNFGIKIPENTSIKISDVAPVVVHAEMPPFSKPGQTIDVTVSAIGEADSLRGGSLLQTMMRGIDGNVYAIAQGSLVVGGLGVEGADGSRVTVNTPTVGRIVNGATVEREIPNDFNLTDSITFNLDRADFTTAKNVADTINNIYGTGSALAQDAVSIRVSAPRDPAKRVEFLSALENLDITEGKEEARIVVNSRTGTIVVGSNVRLRPVAVTHGGLTVTVNEDPQVSQPNPLSQGRTTVVPNSNIAVEEKQGRMFKFDGGTTLDDLVRAVNEVGLAPGDLMSVLEALDQAGAIEGRLVII
ncbi:flagellar basal body P-ring protein FlgI [Anaerobiospirillum sp. NML120449]|uniref:flagellar basal body P-ring protein FlgI n=1 Tax=Anaerobiospirillum sp. NML120449 TaxID=2932817 RepID=UPI001FF5AFCD|nr:flagellar basal body P-ring protein FlgI [Anaerobiospirillum sp. NML120449]MCK0526656.1 flagellar basal body P-ring protein FlgI [Anaerobiospirillum sp. NML120449]